MRSKSIPSISQMRQRIITILLLLAPPSAESFSTVSKTTCRFPPTIITGHYHSSVKRTPASFLQQAASGETAEFLNSTNVPLQSDLKSVSGADVDGSENSIPSYRTMLLFLSTTILIWLSEPLLSLVDTTIVGQYATSNAVLQLAALGPATMLIDSSFYLTYFLAISTTNTIANALAKKDYRRLQTASSQVLGLAALMGSLLTALVFFAGRPLLHWAAGGSSSPPLIQLALRYCQVRSIVAPLSIVGMVSQSICLASLDTKTPALAVAVASIVNVAGDLALVPRWGMQGASIATAAASVASTTVLLNQVKHKMKGWRELEETAENVKEGVEGEETQEEEDVFEGDESGEAYISKVVNGIPILGYTKKSDKSSPTPPTTISPATTLEPVPFLSLPDASELAKLVKLAGPIFFCIFGKIVCYSAMTMRAADLGAVAALAAHNVMMRVFFFFATFGDSVSQASQTFLPGRQKKAANLVRRLAVVATGIGIVNKILGQFVLKHMGHYFSTDTSILYYMASHANWAGWALLLHPFIMLFEGCLLATQDLMFLLGSYAVTMACHFTSLRLGAKTFGGVWKALFYFQTFRLVQFSWRVWTRTLFPRKLLDEEVESDATIVS